MTTLHPSDWADLVHRFEKDNVLFQTFYKSVNDVHLYPVLTINLHTHTKVHVEEPRPSM